MQFPSEYCAFDSTANLHCVSLSGTTFTHHLSVDGGWTWATNDYNHSGVASNIEEWEFQANGELDLFVLNVRYQSSDGPDVDVIYHVREYSEDQSPDTITYVGQGDLDSTSRRKRYPIRLCQPWYTQRWGCSSCLPRLNRPRPAICSRTRITILRGLNWIGLFFTLSEGALTL